ncbi:hypothetical protein AURDEDRAFT_127188 [Auricularia subglabra TFB-10046 SS5]|nr:hypothetical protein AURDEDRAFT_127188 [Auricularia subglabra TFB-10046 SS5]
MLLLAAIQADELSFQSFFSSLWDSEKRTHKGGLWEFYCSVEQERQVIFNPDFPGADNALESSRDHIRQLLESRRLPLDDGVSNNWTSDCSTLWAWFTVLCNLQPTGPRSTYPRSEAYHYFQATFLRLDLCTGDSEVPIHQRISSPNQFCFDFVLPKATATKNTFSQYFQDLFTIDDQCGRLSTCYRHSGNTGRQYCEGRSRRIHAYVSLPCLLFVYVPEGRQQINWKAPKQFIPVRGIQNSGATGVSYHYVGTAFRSGDGNSAHYTAQFTLDGKSLYHYNDLSGGQANRTTTKLTLEDVNRHIAFDGRIQAHTLVYRLEGGYSAYNDLGDWQCVQLLKHYGTAVRIPRALHPPMLENDFES